MSDKPGPRVFGSDPQHDPVSTTMQQAAGRVLLTGATGYVGGRLLRRLEESGRQVRCMVRRPEALSGRASKQTEIAYGDVLEPDTLSEVFAGVTVAYYLVHSMAASEPFAGADRRGAANFAAAARKSGVSRILYLGGLGAEHDVSTHLESRHEVGRILRESGVPTIEFRASIIIGSGSVSFEIVRSLVDRSVEIGGPDRVAYADLMREYARQVGLRRAVIRVPLATPRISGLWLSVVTPVYASIGRELVESLRNDTLVHDGSARKLFPIRPRGFREAIERALANEDREFAETRWSDALSAYRGRNWGGVTLGQRAVASRTIRVAASPAQTFAPIQRIGGTTGWYYGNGFWRLRGLLDKLVGGVGLRRGAPGSRSAGGGRHARLLAGRGLRTGSAPAALSRDEDPWAHLAAVRGRRRLRRNDTAPDSDLRSPRARRARVLVRALPGSPPHLRGDAAKARTGCDRERERVRPWLAGAGLTARPG
jgi:uncharacterized protein YbjT (DUF2867 family)